MRGGPDRALTVLLPALLTLSVLFALGCGKKAMPAPPNRTMPPAVSDFRGELSDGRVKLSWSLSGRAGETADAKPAVPLAEVRVYRSRLPIEEGGCKNCPLPFEPLARLAPPSGGTGKMGYSDRLDRGFRYTYKIVLVGENDAVGPDSDLLDLTYP